MAKFRIHSNASDRLDEIYEYTRIKWGDKQAKNYIQSLFGKFEAIAAREFPWRQIPAEFDVDGFFCRHEKHVIYWRTLKGGDVGIVTVLHVRMHQMDRLKEALN